jgi:hypothetical protein
LENRDLERLDVYLIDDTGEVFLGRVEPAAFAPLALPVDVIARSHGMARLAVIPGVAAGASRTLRPSREAAVVLTVWQPLARLLGQDWVFGVGQLTGRLRRPTDG